MIASPPSARSGSSRSARGLALVTVLWVLVLLSLIAASFTRTTRTEVNIARNLIENAKAEALADAGVHRAIYALLVNEEAPRFDKELDELLQRRPELQEMRSDRIAEQDPRGGWRRDGTIYFWPFQDTAVWISIQDEGGKIDLNASPDALLRGLLLSTQWEDLDGELAGLEVSEANALIDAIRDFADADDLTRLNGAEDRDYAAAGLPWDAKDGPFEAVEELQQVLGFSQLLYEAIRPALTVYNGKGDIDPAVAPREALMALPDIDEEDVDAHIEARSSEPEGAGPLLPLAEGFARRSRGTFLNIRAEAHDPSGAVFVREAVVEMTRSPQQPFAFRVWKTGTRSDLREGLVKEK